MSIIKEGKPNFSCWRGEISEIDLKSYRRENFSDLWLGAREKRWLYVGIYTEDLIIGIAVVHAYYVGNVFCYVYDRKRDILWEQERVAPLAKGIRVDRGLHKGIVSYHTAAEKIYIDTDLQQGKRFLDVQLKSEGREIDIRAEIIDSLEDSPPLQVITPTSKEDFTFTHKNAGLPVLGSVRLGNVRYELDSERDSAVIDYSIGFPARETFWNWASGTGRLKDGRWVGLNLVAPIFDSKNNENAFWIGGDWIKISAVKFDYDPKDPLQDWKITSQDGILDLVFKPIGRRVQDINYQVVASRFQQPFGIFTGQAKLPSGEIIEINFPGVVEEHFARW